MPDNYDEDIKNFASEINQEDDKLVDDNLEQERIEEIKEQIKELSTEEEQFENVIPDLGIYDIPEDKTVFVENTVDGDIKVTEKEDLTPFQKIKLVANETKTKIKEPLDGCKKCYGRGYIGFDSKTKFPVPCGCIFRGLSPNEKETNEQYDNKRINGPVLNRVQRRKLEKQIKKINGR